LRATKINAANLEDADLTEADLTGSIWFVVNVAGADFSDVTTPDAHIALAWLLHKEPVVAPVIGATKIQHLESAVESLSTQLTPEEVAYMEKPYVPHPIVGLIPYGAQE